MVSQYIDLPVEGGGGGGGSVNSVTATPPLFSTGGTDPDISIIPQTPNSFAGFDGSGVLESIPGFAIDTTSGGLDESLTEHPNNGGGSTANALSVAFEPLQNSPNENWSIQNIQAFMDNASSGFNQGVNGSALQVLNLGITHQGTGNTGGLNFINFNSNIGNGTDPITVKGMGFSFAFGQVNANVTLDGSYQGYTFQPSVNASAIGTSNFSVSAFEDFSNIGIPTHGYSSYSAGPNIFQIANNSGYQGVNISPTITTLQGNASYNGFGSAGAITTMGASSSVNGLQFNPSITTSHGTITGVNVTPTVSGGDASFVGLNIAPNGGATLTDPQGININLGSVGTTNPQGAVGLSSDSRIQVNATTTLRSAQTFQIGSRLENLFHIPSGSPVTGTDSLGVNIAGDFSAEDNVANGPIGLGFSSVGFIASVGVAAGKTVDNINVFLPAASLPDPGYTTGGSITDFHMIRTFPPLAQGGTATITNLYGFKIDSLFGDFAAAATNAWGIYLDSTGIKNKLLGGMIYQTHTVTTTYTVDSGSTKDNVVLVDTSSAAFTITLPSPVNGRELTFKDIKGTFATHNLTLNPGSAKIDTVAGSAVYSTNFQSITLVSNGTDWFII